MTRYLVTSALPYANGPIHFGHVVGAYLPADVYVRTLRMQGEDVRFVCGTDEYGVAITIKAEQEGTAYPEYVQRWRSEIKALFDRLGIQFDVWSGTSISPHHAELSLEFFRRLKANGYLRFQEEEQLFCATDDMFLADRYVVGRCPKCEFEEARGDECPRCGSWLDPLALAEPRCKLCGTEPERRTTGHWYIGLDALRDAGIDAWFAERDWKPNVRAFVSGLLDDVRPRPITRDVKWGVPIPAGDFYSDADGTLRLPAGVAPEDPSGKVLYVWFDAPIGYVSFTRELADASGDPESWRTWWQDDETRLLHFIGKDNIPFHCLVFPSMLHGVGADEEGRRFVLPWQVPANEFYNLEGRKFNTSSGWYIDLEDFFGKYDAEEARFYLLASMPETADSEWRWEDFQATTNAILADKIGNLATRVLRFVAKHFDGCIPPTDDTLAAEYDAELLGACGEIGDPAEAVRAFRFRRAAETLAANATVANVYVDRTAPWGLRKTDPARCAAALNTACQYLSWMARWMAPFLPGKAQALWSTLGLAGSVAESGWPGVPGEGWRLDVGGAPRLPAGHRLGEVTALFPKIEDAAVEAEREALRARADS